MEQQPQKETPRRRRGGFKRLVRGYLMIAGAAATIYAVVRVVIVVLVEAQSWRTLLP